MTDFAFQAQRYAFNDGFLDKLTGDLQPADWLHRPGEANHAQWLVGHLAATRRWMLRLLGEDAPEESWEKLFTINAGPTDESDAIAATELRDRFHQAGELVTAALNKLGPEDADREIDQEFPVGGKTVDGLVNFLHFHESYHLGQIGLLRRSVGKPGLI